MEDCTITLPYPPSVNNYKRPGRLKMTKTGKLYQPRVNTDVTKAFYWQVFMRVKQAGLKSFGDAPIALRIDIYPPDHRRRDLDNVAKPGIDSLMHSGLFNDDSQIAWLLVKRMNIIPQGQIIVRIQELVT